MIFLQTKGQKYFLFIQNNASHIIGVVVAPGPPAVVTEVPILMDMEPVHHVQKFQNKVTAATFRSPL